MSNLGDSNTPVEGESFGLPAGAELTEDADGNLAIADSSGSIVLVRDETAGQWDLNNNSLTGINAINASSANVESLSTDGAVIGDGWTYASFFDGDDADERLDAAIDDVTEETTIYLENAEYTEDRTVDKRVGLFGNTPKQTSSSSPGSVIASDWTLTSEIELRNVGVRSELVLDSDIGNDGLHMLTGGGGVDIVIKTNDVTVIACSSINVTFEEDTSGGVVTGCTSTSVTDNGENTVGDIS